MSIMFDERFDRNTEEGAPHIYPLTQEEAAQAEVDLVAELAVDVEPVDAPLGLRESAQSFLPEHIQPTRVGFVRGTAIHEEVISQARQAVDQSHQAAQMSGGGGGGGGGTPEE